MNLTSFFTSNPLVFLFIGIISIGFAIGFVLKRFGWVCFVTSSVALTITVIFSLCFGASYLDVALLSLICLLPLVIGIWVEGKRKGKA